MAGSKSLAEITVTYRQELPSCRWGEGDDAVAISKAEYDAPPAAGELFNLDPFSKNEIIIKGPSAPGELRYGLEYILEGFWDDNKKHGMQFVFNSFRLSEPKTKGAIVAYLKECPHIGQKTALALWDTFGQLAIRTLRTDPTRVVDAGILSAQRASEASTYLAGISQFEECDTELKGLFEGRGFPRKLVKLARTAWGAAAPVVIRRDPFKLLKFPGCGFNRCDGLYEHFRLPPNRIKRQALYAWNFLRTTDNSHTWYPIAAVESAIKDKFKDSANPLRALDLLKRANLLYSPKAIRSHWDRLDNLWIAESVKADDESDLANFIADAMREQPTWLADGDTVESIFEGTPATEHQIDAFREIVKSPVAILRGGPGTGKTFLIALFVKYLLSHGGDKCTAIAALAGKAAVRSTQAMFGYGVNIRATTIHSLLKYGAGGGGGGGPVGRSGFRHNELNPLSFDFIILDESAMQDVGLMCSVFRARSAGTHILLVGDYDQLPPVGHGRPFYDLSAAGVPCGVLTEIQRNSGTIVRACAAIREGRRIETDDTIDLDCVPPKNLYLAEASSQDEQIEKMIRAIRMAEGNGFDPIWDVQVIVPTNGRGNAECVNKLARREINKLLQRELNRTGDRCGTNPFLTGDKIVNTSNGWLPLEKEFLESIKACDVASVEQTEFEQLTTYRTEGGSVTVNGDGKVYVSNGDVAAVVKVEDKLTIARMSDPTRLIVIPRGATPNQEGDVVGGGANGNKEEEQKTNTGCDWDLSYATSGHRAQGSEYPIAIVMIDESAVRTIGTREWAYTGISRGKLLCVLVGKMSTFLAYCRRQAIVKRKTFLRELLVEAMRERSERPAGVALAGSNTNIELQPVE